MASNYPVRDGNGDVIKLDPPYVDRRFPKKRNRLAIIGTSLAQHQTNGAVTPRVSWWSRGFLAWAYALTFARFEMPFWFDSTVVPGWEPSGVPDTTNYIGGLNFGVSGQTLQQVIDRLPRIDSDYGDMYDIIVVDGGTNDISGGATKEHVHEKRMELCEHFLSQGKIVILLTIPARATSQWSSGSSLRKSANWINIKSREYVYGRKNLYLFDWNRWFQDAADADGQPISGMSDDGTHMTTKAGEAIGIAFAEFIKDIIPEGPQTFVWSRDDVYDATHNPKGNLLTNPFLAGTSGTEGTGASGDTADTMRIERNSGSSCSVVGSKEASTDNRGSKQVLTFTLGGSAEEKFYFRTNTANTTVPVAGMWVEASCVAETNNSDAITQLELYLQDMTTGGVRVSSMYPYTISSAGEAWPARERKLLLRTPPLFLPDTTGVRWRVEITVKGNGSVAPVIKLSECVLRPVEDPRPAVQRT